MISEQSNPGERLYYQQIKQNKFNRGSWAALPWKPQPRNRNRKASWQLSRLGAAASKVTVPNNHSPPSCLLFPLLATLLFLSAFGHSHSYSLLFPHFSHFLSFLLPNHSFTSYFSSLSQSQNSSLHKLSKFTLEIQWHKNIQSKTEWPAGNRAAQNFSSKAGGA